MLRKPVSTASAFAFAGNHSFRAFLRQLAARLGERLDAPAEAWSDEQMFLALDDVACIRTRNAPRDGDAFKQQRRSSRV